MSASKRIALAVAFAWLSRAVTILANLFLIPILFRFLGKEELGLWFLLGNSQAFLTLLGMGIVPTLTRHIALAKGKSGADPGVELTEESKQHIGDLVVTGRILLQGLAVVVFFIAWASGYGLIGQLELKEVSPQTVFWAWTLMCAGYAVGIWVSYLNCLLAGIGYVGWDSLMGTVVSVLAILANIGAVLLGGGLLALAAILVVSSLVQRFAILGFIHWRKPELFAVQGRWNSKYAKAMVKPSLYCWFTSLGGFLILRTDGYFIALLKGTGDLPNYQAAYQLVSNLYLLAVTWVAASGVFISQAWQASDFTTIHKITLRNAKVAISIMGAGVAFLLLAGQELINLWLGKGNFVGYEVLGIFCIMLTLETHHVILMQSSRATEDENYAFCTVTAGVLNVILTWFLIKPLGLLGVAIGTMLAQLLTTNWYAVYRPVVRLKLNFRVYSRQVIGLWGVILASCSLLSWLTKKGLMLSDYTSEAFIVGGVAAACIAVFFVMLWIAILENHQRKLIQKTLAKWMEIKA
jgi:O-antigen/teichoic acid export membrane protein